jgi:tRNA(Ile)-lysidine synthase
VSSHASGGPLAADAVLGQLNGEFPQPEAYWVAFSGGLDSTVLLNLLAGQRAWLRAPLSAVHVDHGLHAESPAWAQHCRSECERLSVPLTTLLVDAAPLVGESPEAAARAARYAAIATALEPRAMLLTAHHLDDQAETLLLQLLRGAGVAGLAAMPRIRRWQAGWHARPLLGLPRTAIHAWAVGQGLHWVDDPSNADHRADRNYLRHQVMPALTARWPKAAANLARSAGHCAEAAELIAAQASDDLRAALTPDGQLRVAVLRRLPPLRARGLLQAWLRRQGAPPLPAPRLSEALDQLCHARADAAVRIEWGGTSLRRFRDSVWLVADRPAAPPARPLDWLGEELSPGPGLGRIGRRLAPGGVDPLRWEQGRVQIGYRRSGLCCQPAGRTGRRSFKKLAQECGIPPWLRHITPILLIDGEAAAIANCCVCAPFAAPRGEIGWVIDWTPD